MLSTAQGNRWHQLIAILVSCFAGVLAPITSIAQTPDGVVSIVSEPDHKIRFDNGRVRMYEIVLPKGKASLFHEHRADSFSVIIDDTEVTNEPRGGKPLVIKAAAGRVGFSSTAKGPYSHRVIASGETTFHVIAMELMSPTPTGSPNTAQRAGRQFKVVLENPRGRAYSIALAPGESTEAFTRSADSALFAISAGRISETLDGKPQRLWDFERGHFKWIDVSERLSIKNEGTTPIHLVEIELF